MGPISVVLEFIHARKWLVELILVGVLVAAVGTWHHLTFEKGVAEGVAKQQADDSKADEELRALVARQQTQIQALADAAKVTHDNATAQNAGAAAAPVGTSQLCKPAPAHDSQVGVHEAGRSDSRTAAPPTPAQVGVGVPAADNGQPYDRRTLLGAFAHLLDDTDATLDEFQTRAGVAPRLN